MRAISSTTQQGGTGQRVGGVGGGLLCASSTQTLWGSSVAERIGNPVTLTPVCPQHLHQGKVPHAKDQKAMPKSTWQGMKNRSHPVPITAHSTPALSHHSHMPLQFPHLWNEQ